MTFHTQRQCFQSLEKDESVEGRDGGARVAQDDGADACHKSRLPRHVGKHGTVVRRVGLRQRRIFVGIGFPVEGAAVNDDTAEARTVAADEFCSRMHHDVSPVFNGADEIRRAEGVVNDEDDVVAVGHLCHGLQVRDVGIGVAKRFRVNHLRVRADDSLQRLRVVDVDDGVADALRGQRVRDEVKRTAVEIVGGNDVIASGQHILQSVSHGSGAACNGQTRHAAFEGGHARFKNALCGIS